MYFMMKTQNLFFMSIHFLGAAFAEEYLYRQIIFNDIRRNYNAVLALLFSSFLFAFIGHMGEDIVDNLFIPITFRSIILLYKDKI